MLPMVVRKGFPSTLEGLGWFSCGIGSRVIFLIFFYENVDIILKFVYSVSVVLPFPATYYKSPCQPHCRQPHPRNIFQLKKGFNIAQLPSFCFFCSSNQSHHRPSGLVLVLNMLWHCDWSFSWLTSTLSQ